MIRLLLLLCAPAFSAAAAPAAPADPVLVVVDGRAVSRTDVAERLWARYGNAALNEVVDQILVDKASKAAGVKPSASEVETRLKRIQSRFADEATFKTRLAETGTRLEDIKADIAAQYVRETLVTKAKNLKVSDAELKSVFEANKEKLAQPESVRLRHILVASEKEASDFLLAIRAGADFSKLASEVSLDPASKPRGGDLGFIAKGILAPEIEKLVFSLQKGQVAGPIKSGQGFHIFKAEESTKAKPARYEDVKENLKSAILAEKISAAWPDYIAELRRAAKITPPQQR